MTAIASARTAFETASELMQEERYPEALLAYREATKLDNQDPRFQIGLGVCLMKLHHWDEAIKSLLRGLELKPHYGEPDARLFLAESLVAVGQKRKAIEQWKVILRMRPEYPSYDKPMDEARQQLARHGVRS